MMPLSPYAADAMLYHHDALMIFFSRCHDFFALITFIYFAEAGFSLIIAAFFQSFTFAAIFSSRRFLLIICRRHFHVFADDAAAVATI